MQCCRVTFGQSFDRNLCLCSGQGSKSARLSTQTNPGVKSGFEVAWKCKRCGFAPLVFGVQRCDPWCVLASTAGHRNFIACQTTIRWRFYFPNVETLIGFSRTCQILLQYRSVIDILDEVVDLDFDGNFAGYSNTLSIDPVSVVSSFSFSFLLEKFI